VSRSTLHLIERSFFKALFFSAVSLILCVHCGSEKTIKTAAVNHRDTEYTELKSDDRTGSVSLRASAFSAVESPAFLMRLGRASPSRVWSLCSLWLCGRLSRLTSCAPCGSVVDFPVLRVRLNGSFALPFLRPSSAFAKGYGVTSLSGRGVCSCRDRGVSVTLCGNRIVIFAGSGEGRNLLWPEIRADQIQPRVGRH